MLFIIYTIGVLISGIISGIVLYNTDDDITKKDVCILGFISVMSFLGLLLMVIAAFKWWLDNHGDEILIKRNEKL